MGAETRSGGGVGYSPRKEVLDRIYKLVSARDQGFFDTITSLKGYRGERTPEGIIKEVKEGTDLGKLLYFLVDSMEFKEVEPQDIDGVSIGDHQSMA